MGDDHRRERNAGPREAATPKDVSERQRRAATVLARADVVELRIEKLVQGALGLGRLEGVPILVPRTAPGDRVRVELTERRAGFGRARLLELLAPGAGRREPPCPVYERCGGCDLQHIEDERQAPLKAEAALETLRRLGGQRVPGEPKLVVGSSWGYRLRAQWRVEGEGPTVRVGYLGRSSHDLVPTSVCPILDARLERELSALPDLLRRNPRPPRRIDAAVGDAGPSFAPVIEGLPHGPLRLAAGDAEYEFDARTFFQVHRGLVGQLLAEVVGEERGDAAWDLYAGVGLFSIPLARRYQHVQAVESDRVAARYLRRNAGRQSGAGDIEVHNVSVERFVGSARSMPDRVVVDPPRAGLAPSVLRALRSLAPPRLTYVSCDPATLARDLRGLAERYVVERLTFLDLFPQTAHLETVVQLARSA